MIPLSPTNSRFDGIYVTRSFFIARASDIIEQNTRLPLPTFNYCLDSFESIEIDYPDQLLLARKIATCN